MKKYAIIVIITLSAISQITAQTALDALRYSRIYYNGTARFMATAGSFGAVGANFSTVATNPAGLGLYRSAEVTFSPTFFGSFNTSEYNGFEAKDYKLNFALANIGYVYTFRTGNPNNSGGLRSISVGFGMNRQNNFNSRFYIQGPNHSSSLMNSFTGTLNSSPPINPKDVRYYYPFDIGLAYDCGLIFYDSLQNKYLSDMPNGGVFQDKAVTTWGSINEFDISVGGNIADALYFGFTIGIPTIRYYYESSYWEEDTGDTIPYFQSLQYDYNYETHGTGVNFKAGLIYRPADWIRIGAAVHTPTFYPSMYDYYASNMSALYDSILSFPVQYSPSGSYNYQMMTPFRFIGSLAFFISNHGFISGEYEFVNYNQARFRAAGDNFSDINSEIIDSYKAPVNFRVGTEWRIKIFRIRGGFGYNGVPDTNGDFSERYTINGGFGVYIKQFFVDMAYRYSHSTSNYYLYDRSMVNPAGLTTQTHSATTTFGFRF